MAADIRCTDGNECGRPHGQPRLALDEPGRVVGTVGQSVRRPGQSSGCAADGLARAGGGVGVGGPGGGPGVGVTAEQSLSLWHLVTLLLLQMPQVLPAG